MKKIHETETEIFYLKEPSPDLVRMIQSKFDLTELTARIIANREIESPKEITSYLSPQLKNLPNPFLFQDMRKIVTRIYNAIEQRETILVYGDYDVDGITSTSLLVKFFDTFNFPIQFYVPNRFEDGYGLNKERLLTLYHTDPFHLLITVDCGISGNEACIALSNLGVDTIVTDHHRADKRPGNAIGVLDPSLKDCSFPYKGLAGVGVVFFLLIALRNYLRELGFWESRKIPEPDLREYLELVCIGTIADLAPLTGINRILATSGLKILSNSKSVGVRRFLEGLGISREKSIAPWEVSFQIAPCLNAAGRLENATMGVTLLTTKDSSEAYTLSGRLEGLNRKRQAIENKLLEDAKTKIEANKGVVSPFAIVLWCDDWHEGVIGIVASKLVGAYGRPVALIRFEGNGGKGSLRGIPGVDIFQALKGCQSWLTSFGGHAMAGGIKIDKSNISRFAEEFSRQVESQLGGHPPKSRWYLDHVAGHEGIPDKFFHELPRIEPFGIGNPSPLLGISDFEILSKRLIQEKHIRLTLKLGTGKALQAIAFNAEEYWEELENITGIVGTPNINHWNGNAIPQITIKRFLKKGKTEQFN